METLGGRLCYARRKNGYTQESRAEAIGVSRGVIYNLEKNKTQPQRIVVNAICEELGIRREWLLEGAGEMEKEQASQSARLLAELYEAARGLSEDEQLYLLDIVKAMRRRFSNKT